MKQSTLIKNLLLLIGLISINPMYANDREPVFVSGEKITYKLYYNWNFVWLSAGEVIFEVKDEGDLYHVEVTGRTYASYEWFYKVRDKYHSYIDKKTLLPKLYIRDIQQGNYIHYEKVEYDHVRKKMISYTGKTMKDAKPVEIPMQGECYDLVSTLYHLRNHHLGEFKKSKRIDFNLILDNRIYNLGIKLEKERSKFHIKEKGNFKVLECKGSVVEGQVFNENTELKVYVGDDENKLPLMIESPLSVGSVKAVLISEKNLKHPLFCKL
ncbi:MAG: DUF3108 domain-containing protein [Saprospiraceae bacterium]|nr:DUF3108 domain-containing protein [Saprospiraceae bacterium]MBK7810207.1 DUF3108 domain-containing protein [Saprospiraceae bacterium]